MTTTPVATSVADVETTPAPRPPRRWAGLLIPVVVIAAVVGGGLVVPYVVKDTYTMGLFLEAAILSLLALGIGFLARHLGLISLGHTAFFGISAYTVAIAITHWEWAPLPAFAVGIVGGTLAALVMGVLVVRASGMGFLMLTLALSQAVFQLTVQTAARPLTGAHDGLLISYPDADATFLGLTTPELLNPGLFWLFAWLALSICAVALWLLGRSRFGTLLEGIRENEERMRFSGYSTFVPRLVAFVVSGAVASVGGALFALNAGYVSPSVLGFQTAGDALIATLIGGPATLLGPVLGMALFVYAQANFNFGGNLHLLTGLALVAVLVFMPGGITGAAGRLVRRLRGRKDDS